MRLRDCHYAIGLLLSLGLIPVFRALDLPVQFDWMHLGIAFWIILTAQSIFVAALLCLIALPRQVVFDPLVDRYRRNPLRIVLLLLYLGILAWAFTWVKALILTVDAIALLEFRERRNLDQFRQAAAAVLAPALYLFAGFLLVFAYNDIIVSVRFNFTYDPAFNGMDRAILHGLSVSDLAHWAIRTFPLSFFHFLEFIYFGMFPQIGAGIILVTLYDGKLHGLQFVGTILLAYYLALGLFYLWPSHGPYYLCPAHFSRFPSTLQAYTIQKSLMAHALDRWNHVPIERISTDYFIAFPCMHIAQPLIVMWFLRRWKRMLLVLCAYDALLIVAILFLEWHYLVDLVGGLLVASLSIAFTEGSVLRGSFAPKARSPVREGTPAL
jgi:PAP2 superfamily